MGLAAHLATANPQDFTPRAWQKALEQANDINKAPDFESMAKRDKPLLSVEDAKLEIRDLLRRGVSVNKWVPELHTVEQQKQAKGVRRKIHKIAYQGRIYSSRKAACEELGITPWKLLRDPTFRVIGK